MRNHRLPGLHSQSPCLFARVVQPNTKRCCFSLPATDVLPAVWRATTVCVGGAAINLACSESTMLDADAACLSKRGAACRRAHVSAATPMLAARSFCYR